MRNFRYNLIKFFLADFGKQHYFMYILAGKNVLLDERKNPLIGKIFCLIQVERRVQSLVLFFHSHAETHIAQHGTALIWVTDSSCISSAESALAVFLGGRISVQMSP